MVKIRLSRMSCLALTVQRRKMVASGQIDDRLATAHRVLPWAFAGGVGGDVLEAGFPITGVRGGPPHSCHRVPLVKEMAGELLADKAGTTGKQEMHARLFHRQVSYCVGRAA